MVKTGPQHDTLSHGRIWWASLVLGAAGGALVGAFAFWLARYGPSGDSWSFRGNGAIAAYSLVPALLAGGWTALVLRFKGRPDWLALGCGAGVIGLLLAIADAVLLPLGGVSADVTVGGVLLLALAAWTVAAPILSWAVISSGVLRPISAGTLAAGVVLWFVGLLLGVVALGVVLPAGS